MTRSPSAPSGRSTPGRRLAGRLYRRTAIGGLHCREKAHGGRPKRVESTPKRLLVYKVLRDGVEGLDLGGSSAQSVILMLIVIALTVPQFRYVERGVQYQ
jgi:hypothetical protein